MGGLVSIELKPRSTKCMARANVAGALRAEAHADVSMQAVFSDEAILTDHLATGD